MQIAFTPFSMESFEPSFGSTYVKNKLDTCKLSGESILDFSGFAIGNDDCFAIKSFICDFASSGNVIELNLSDCSLGDRNASVIFAGIKFHPSLKKLNLKGNGLTASSCEAIGSLLHENSILSHLILAWNELGIDDALFSRLAAGLLINNGLKEVDLRSNQLTGQAAARLGDAFAQNRSLINVDLRWNSGIGLLGGQSLVKTMSKSGESIQLNSLRLDGCNVPSDMVDIINGWLLLNRAKQHAFAREENALRAITQHAKSSVALNEEKVKSLTLALATKDAEIRLVEENWREQLENITAEMTDAKGKAVTATSRLSTLESELALERHRSADLQGQMDGALEAARQSASVAAAAEAKLSKLSNELERRWIREKAQIEQKSSDLSKQVDQMRVSLEDTRQQRIELEERAAKLASEKAALELELSSAKSGTEMALVHERTTYQERLEALERRWREAVSASDNDRMEAERQHSAALRDATDELTRVQRSLRDLTQVLSTTQQDLATAREEADSAKQRAERASKDTAQYVSEYNNLRSQAESAISAERKATEKVHELEREVERLSLDNSVCRKKLERLYGSLNAAYSFVRQLNHPLQECLALTDENLDKSK